jgi:site-specific DNA-cytosine methylase
MKILIACEFSGIVREAFKAKGHDVMSCDLLPTEIPGEHYQGDIRDVIDQDWDMIISFPPCTHLAVSGARYFRQKQADGRQEEAIKFFLMIACNPCEQIAVENPIGIMSNRFRKPDQIIQPYQFGHPESKKTCLWLKGLPKLQPTNILQKPKSGRWNNQTKDGQNRLIVDSKWIGFNDKRTARLRGKTYKGIAEAMANQWG